MKSFLSMLIGWVALGLLPALPIYAAMVAVDESDLPAISGKSSDLDKNTLLGN